MKEGYESGNENISNIDALTSHKVVVLANKQLENLPPPDPRDFIDLPGSTEDSVILDEREIERLKKIFAGNEAQDPALKESKEFAAALEALIMINAELCNWFGSDARTIRVSEYDDIKNGVDFIIRFPDGVTIAVDVTASERQLGKKFDRIRDEIDRGELAEIKYFYDEDADERGTLKNIPRVIIAADGRTIGELGELWLKNKNEKERKEGKKDLERHFIQIQMLKEIELQLEAFIGYASGREEIISRYEDVLQKVKEILGEKLGNKDIPRRGDRMFMAIQNQLGSFEAVAA